MSNKFFKRTVAVTTSVATTLSLSGVSLLAPIFVAQASSHIMDGDTIKTADNPDVYIAKHMGSKKFKRLILNPDVFNSYGHLSWSNIKTVSSADMAMYTNSQLVRAVGDPKVYMLSSAANSDTGQKSWLNMTAAEFVAASYDWDSIYEINTVDRDNYTVTSDTTPTVTPPVTTTYSVKLHANNPAAGTLMDNSAFNEVLRAEVMAGSSAINVTSVSVERYGITQDTDLSGIAIFDSMGVRHGNVLTLSSKKATFDFTSEPISISAGGMGTVSVRINIANAAQSGTVGMKITAMSGTPSGLPVMGNEFSLADGANVLGAIEADINTQTTSQVTVNVNTKDQNLTKLSLGETSGKENVWLKSVTFQQNGSAADGDVMNWDLVSPAGAVLSTVTNSVSKLVKFDLSASPWQIKNGTTDVFDVRVDVINGTSRTVQAVVQNNYDIELVGKDTGVSILSTADATDGDDASFPIGDVTNEDTLSIGSGTMTLSKSTLSPSGLVAAGANDVTLATFNLKVEGEDMEVRQVDLYFSAIVVPDNADSGTTANEPDDILTGTVKLVKGDGATVYSVAAGDSNPATTETTVTLSSYFTIKAGTTETMKVIGNIRTDAASTDSFTFAMQDIYVKRIVTNDFATLATSEVTANNLTGTTGSLTAIKNQAIGNRTVIGSSNTLLGSFILQTSSAEGVNVTAIAPDISGTGVVAGDFDSWWLEVDNSQKCDGTTSKRFGSIDTAPALTADSFTGSLSIPVSSQVVLDACADTSSSIASDDAPIVTLPANDVDGTTLLSQQSVDNGSTAATGQTMTVKTSGLLKVKTGTNPIAGVMNSSNVDVKVMELVVSPLYENVEITQFRFWEVGNSHRDFTDVSLYVGTTKLQSKAADAETRGVYDFTGLTEQITAGTSKTYSVYVDSTDVNASGKGDVAQIYFGSMEARGLSSGADILEYDSEGFVGTTTVEPGNASSIGHYRQGDLVLSMNNASTGDPFGVVRTAENEATSITASGLDLGLALNETFTVSEYVAKIGGTALNGAPNVGLKTTGIAANNFVVVLDTSANAIRTGLVSAVTADVDITVLGSEGSTAVTLAAGDVNVELGGTGLTATVAAAGDFTTVPAVGDLIFYYDVSATGDSEFGIVTAYTNDGGASNADTIVVNGEALDHAAASTSVASTDRYFGFTMDITQEAFSTSAGNDYNVGDVVFHFDASADSSESGFAVVTTGVRAGETMANLVTSLNGGITAAASDRFARIAPRPVGTNSWTMHDAEPVVTVDNAGIGTASQQAMQDMARYKITATGGTLTIESLRLTVFGSGADDLTTATNGIEVWVDGVREYQAGDLSPVATSGTDFTIDFANAIDINNGATKTFLVKINTLGLVTTNETTAVKLGGNQGYRGGPIDFFYTSTGSNGTVPTGSSPADITDSVLPLLGVTVTP